MNRMMSAAMLVTLAMTVNARSQEKKARALGIDPPAIATDKSVKYDYDIVYVRAPRKGDDQQILWADVFAPLRAEPGSDLMLLHPDGSEEVLVAAGDDAVADPFVSFDGEWVYYARFHNVRGPAADRPLSQSSDIFKIHVKSRKVVPLTQQAFTPNTGVVAPNLKAPGVYNLGPCPLPGGRVMFTSNRNGFAPTKDYKEFAAMASNKSFMPNSTLQLFVMDDDGRNVDMIGHLNINGALHPTILKDGRVMFSSFESQGLRDMRMWAIWTIHPDGANWAPLASALGTGGETVRHFMTQLSDGHIVFEDYYIQHTMGFGTYYRLAAHAPEGQPFFGPASNSDPRNLKYANHRNLQFYNRFPFSPHGLEDLTPFSHFFNSPSLRSDPNDPDSPYLGKVTHPSGAPDNHLLTVWSPGPVHGVAPKGHHVFKKPAIDSGIYLIKDGKPVKEPGQMLRIKNDPNYNEQWPRAQVPYKRIHGVDEPARLTAVRNDGKRSPHLPEGTPYGLVGASSLYKRETYPNGSVPQGQVTATFPGGNDPFQGLGGPGAFSSNWSIQGADAGKYSNSDIHAIRIVITEPTTDPRYAGQASRRWWNVANERLRILGEFPVRHFASLPVSLPRKRGEEQSLDPDGNPDTSFLVKIPADVAWTFQTLDKHGMVLNMAQTWHQLRPGEVRTDCGGCHAHSQRPTEFKDTAAAKLDYPIFDLTTKTPLLTAKANDQSGKQWDVNDTTGLRYVERVQNVEYFHDVKPILDRSCSACHTQKAAKPGGNLVLDDDRPIKASHGNDPRGISPSGNVSGTFARLALPGPRAVRYVQYFQSRRSLLVWKIYGQRLDGFAHEPFTGSAMPPPAAVAGDYDGPDGKKIKVAPLTDEDRRTIVRWIDLGCPIDLDFDLAKPQARGHGWLADDNRPTLTLTYPRAGVNTELSRILVGMHDYDSGLDMDSFEVVADSSIPGAKDGANLASKFKLKSPGVWELTLTQPLTELARGQLTVAVKDKQGNQTRIERTFSVKKP